jgi:hypothetical protein
VNTKYHFQICKQALSNAIAPAVIQTISWANVFQDIGPGFFQPRFHFDGGQISAALQYIENQRELAVSAVLKHNNPLAARRAFGRLLHCRQDFYAHTNYVHLWAEQHPQLQQAKPEQLPLCHNPLQQSGLITCRTNLPIFLLYRMPWVGDWLRSWYLPADEHEAINLDHPKRGYLYTFAHSAAVRHTVWEWEQVCVRLQVAGEDAVRVFTGQKDISGKLGGVWVS